MRHTPNSYQHSQFTAIFHDVSWGIARFSSGFGGSIFFSHTMSEAPGGVSSRQGPGGQSWFQRNPTEGAMHCLLPRKADNHLQQIIGPWNSTRGSALKHWTYWNILNTLKAEGCCKMLQVTLAFETLLYFTNHIYWSLISLMWRQCFKCSWCTSDHASSTDAWCVFHCFSSWHFR